MKFPVNDLEFGCALVRAVLTALCFAWALISLPSLSGAAELAEASGPQVVYLRADPVAYGAQITLGDLFADAGPAASVRIAMAPPPGRRIGLDAVEVARLARDHGLAWGNTRGVRRVLVTRASQTVPLPRIRAALKDSLSAAWGGETLDIQINGRPSAFHVDIEAEATIGIDVLTLDERTGRFRARVRVPEDAPETDGVVLTGQAHRLMPVPVLARTMAVGSEIGADDWTWADWRADRIGRNAVIGPDQIEGMALRRTVRAGTVLRVSDLARPVMVGRGDLVTVSVRRPGMELTATGRALKDGAMGDVIQVRNTNSMRIIDVTITGRGRADAMATAIRTAAR